MRRSPLLARGRVTFDAILEATARLLENGGIGAITTNRVAEAAGINVATLYHYFPNKQAILVALFEKQTHERAIGAKAIVGRFAPAATGAKNWVQLSMRRCACVGVSLASCRCAWQCARAHSSRNTIGRTRY